MKKYKCIKSLFKSTYNKNAFNEDKIYNEVEDDGRFSFINDETGHAFPFSKEMERIFYSIEEYFIEV